MKKLLLGLVTGLALLLPGIVFGQTVQSQSTLILQPYGNNGFLYSSSTAVSGKLAATSSPYFSTFTAGTAVINALTVTSCTGCGSSSSFSTTSANYWASLGLAFSTTSTDYWKTQNNFFSTTSASYFLLQNQGGAFSTTSASYFSSLGLAFSTTSASYFLLQNQGGAFSTTSAAYFLLQNQGPAFSTTSAAYFSSLGLAFSTTSANSWQTTRDFFSTTSQNYYQSQFRDWKITTGFLTPSSTVQSIGVFGSSTIGNGSLGLTVNGPATSTNLTVTSAAGSAGCATFSTLGVISNTGVACGSGGGTDSNWSIVGGFLAPTTSIGVNLASNTGYYMGGTLLAYASTSNKTTVFGLGAGGQAATTSSLATISGTYVGYLAGNALNSGGLQNVAIGEEALLTATSSDFNTAVGYNALWNQNGFANTGIGYNAFGGGVGYASSNTGVGYSVGQNLTTGTLNSYLGAQVAQVATTGGKNTGIGAGSLANMTTGQNNTALGYQSALQLTTGYDNVFIGSLSNVGNLITTGANNIGIGTNAFFQSTTSNNQLNIGNILYGTLPATTTNYVLPTTGSIGIGTSSPYGKFSVALNNGDTNATAFVVASSTASATTTLFNISNTGSITTTLSTGCVNSTAGVLGSTGVACGSGSGGGLATTSPTASSNVLVYSAAGAGAAYGVATTTLAGTGILSVSNSPIVIGASPAVASITGGSNGQVLGWLGGVPAWTASSSVAAGTGISIATAGAVTTVTNSGVTSVTGTYPVVSSGGQTPAVSLAFGTTTSNTWANTQTFTNAPVVTAFSVAGTVNNLANGTTYSTPTSTPTVTAPITYSGTLGSFTGGSSGAFACATCLTANQTITLSGDVSGSGSTAITTTIGSNKVTVGMLAQAAANTVLGNPTGSTANVQAFATSSLFTGTAGQNAIFTNTGNLVGTSSIFTNTTTGNIGIDDTTPDFNLEIATPNANGYFGITNTADGDVLAVTTAGFVGIATTTPQWALTVSSATKPQIVLTDSSLTSAAWALRSAGGYFYISSTSPSTFATTTITNALTISPGGKVGIGTSTPQAGLHLYDSDSLGCGNTSEIFGGRDGGDTDYWGCRSANNDGLSNDPFQWGIGNVPGTNPVMTLLGSKGSLGIGTTTPVGTLNLASSTGQQLVLSDGSASSVGWNVRNAGGTLYIGTSSPSTFATSSNNLSAVQINPTGSAALGVATSTPWRTLSVTGTVGFDGLTAAAGTVQGICLVTATKELVANAAATCVVSSRKSKQNIQDLTVGLDTVLKMKTFAFQYKDSPDITRYGFMAEDMADLDPILADYDKDGEPATIDTTGILALNTKAIQEQQEEIESLMRGVILVKQSAQDNWQWMALALLAIILLLQQLQIVGLKKRL